MVLEGKNYDVASYISYGNPGDEYDSGSIYVCIVETAQVAVPAVAAAAITTVTTANA